MPEWEHASLRSLNENQMNFFFPLGRHRNQRGDRVRGVQHHPRHCRVRPVRQGGLRPQLVLSGQGLRLLSHLHRRSPRHYFQRTRVMVGPTTISLLIFVHCYIFRCLSNSI